MTLEGNTIFVSGGSSGIGRALAEELHRRGNRVIIAGRRAELLAGIAQANPGMAFVPLDVADPASIAAAARHAIAEHPAVNMLVSAAGIQRVDDPAAPIDDALLTETLATNFLGGVRLASAFLPHFRSLPAAAIMHVSSMLAYLPLAQVSIYCATKAALHSFVLSQRHALRDTNVRVREIIPPYVQTDLLNGMSDPRAMPLDRFIAETIESLARGDEEVLVPVARERRDAMRGDEVAMTAAFNDRMGSI